MKILLVHPGANVSVSDVFEGLRYGLKAHGVEVIPYGLHGRIRSSRDFMHYLWRKSQKLDAGLSKPTWADIMYHASAGLLERALRHEADLVLAVSGMFLHPDALVLLRRAGLRTGILFTEAPYNLRDELKLAQLVDIAWTNERSSVGAFRRVCPNAHYLAHAWHPTRHLPDLPIPADTPRHDVVFVGSGWPERVRFFEGINWDGIDLGIYGTNWNVRKRSPLAPFVHDEVVPNEQTGNLYRAAKIGINLHRSLLGFSGDSHLSAGSAESANPRAYELAACGAFHISDTRAEVVEQFGEAVPTFRSPEEAEALIRQYLPDDAGRARASSRLPALVAEDSWLHRAAEVLVHISSSLVRAA